MNISNYSVEIIIKGRPVREFEHWIDGEYRHFIEGRENSEYSIRVTNNSSEKILALASVDGLNVVSGKITTPTGGRGYIVNSHSNVIIKGFRESDLTVGTFKFTNKHASYAKEKGPERNCGLVAVNIVAPKVIPEPIVKEIHHHHDHYIDRPYPKPYPVPVEPPWRPWKPYDPIWCVSDGDSSGATYSCSNDVGQHTNSLRATSNFVGVEKSESRQDNFQLGTSWGARVEDKIQRKHFAKGDVIASFKIFYTTRQGLENLGINFHPQKEIDDWPQGFTEYAKAPKGWSG